MDDEFYYLFECDFFKETRTLYLPKFYIMQTRLCNEYPLTPHFYIVKLGFTGVYLIFLFLL